MMEFVSWDYDSQLNGKNVPNHQADHIHDDYSRNIGQHGSSWATRWVPPVITWFICTHLKLCSG